MHFTKMHGCGNDYVYVDCLAHPQPADPVELAKRISDRHYGVGSDGLILILPSKIADARMRMWNADGSEGVMCGNGIRCVAKYLRDHGIVNRSVMAIETGRGVLAVEVVKAGGRESWIQVNMGEPIIETKKIPVSLQSAQAIGFSVNALNVPMEYRIAETMTALSMGNPHGVFFVEDVQAVRLEAVGPFWEKHAAFPNGVNISVVSLRSRSEVNVRTWERGSGATLACGTGACAVCVAGVLTHRTGRQILAHLPGGDLQLHWSENDNHVYMTGPAVEVFSGDWSDD